MNGEILSSPWTFADVQADSTGGFIDGEGFSIWWETLEKDGGKLLRSTGKTDMSGYEIFEDYLLMNRYSGGKCSDCGSPQFNRDSLVYVVKWDDKEAKFEAVSTEKDEDGNPMNWLDPESWHEYAEIIGNLHENPNLARRKPVTI